MLRNGTVALEPTCPPVTARIRSTRRGTRVQASWTGCGGSRRVRLDARIDAATCSTVRGVVRSSKKPRNRVVKTTRSPYDVAARPAQPVAQVPAQQPRRTAGAPCAVDQPGGHLWTFQTGKGIFSTPVDRRRRHRLRRLGRPHVLRARAPTARCAGSSSPARSSTPSALLDDRGRVYFGSGDGKLYALDAATGAPVWTFTADPPSATGAFINWFEGNVAIGADGTLYVPNDNFFTYALDRDTRRVRWRFRTADQTWSLPGGRRRDAAGSSSATTTS